MPPRRVQRGGHDAREPPHRRRARAERDDARRAPPGAGRQDRVYLRPRGLLRARHHVGGGRRRGRVDGRGRRAGRRHAVPQRGRRRQREVPGGGPGPLARLRRRRRRRPAALRRRRPRLVLRVAGMLRDADVERRRRRPRSLLGRRPRVGLPRPQGRRRRLLLRAVRPRRLREIARPRLASAGRVAGARRGPRAPRRVLEARRRHERPPGRLRPGGVRPRGVPRARPRRHRLQGLGHGRRETVHERGRLGALPRGAGPRDDAAGRRRQGRLRADRDRVHAAGPARGARLRDVRVPEKPELVRKVQKYILLRRGVPARALENAQGGLRAALGRIQNLQKGEEESGGRAGDRAERLARAGALEGGTGTTTRAGFQPGKNGGAGRARRGRRGRAGRARRREEEAAAARGQEEEEGRGSERAARRKVPLRRRRLRPLFDKRRRNSMPLEVWHRDRARLQGKQLDCR